MKSNLVLKYYSKNGLNVIKFWIEEEKCHCILQYKEKSLY